MIKIKEVSKSFFTLFLIITLLIGSGCTKYASQEDLKTLEAAKAAAISAEKELSNKKSERKQLEADLAKIEKEFSNAEAEYEKAKSKPVNNEE